MTMEEIEAHRMHFYILPDYRRIDLGSCPGKTEEVVFQIDVASYCPKSWTNGGDPEFEKFLRSLRTYKQYDLEGGPSQPALQMPASGTPAAASSAEATEARDAPVESPPGAAGR